MIIDLNWSDFKSMLSSKGLPFDYIEKQNDYLVYSVNGGIYFSVSIEKNSADATDFINNYQSNASLIEKIDVAGRKILRSAATIEGWHYQLLSSEFTTSDLDGFYCKDKSGNDLGFVSCKLFDSNNAEIINAQNELNAVKSVFYIRPNHSYEVIGAIFGQNTVPTTNIRMFVTGLPGVANVKFSIGGINLKHVGTGAYQLADGRASKYLGYVSQLPDANSFEITCLHDVGLQHNFMISFEIFRAV